MKRQLPIFQFRVQNAGNDAVDIYIDGGIVDAETQEFYREYWGDNTSVSYKSFRQEVEAASASTFNVHINSYGGQLIEALAIHDLLIDLQNKGKTVNTIGRGLIASAATYILMAGKNSQMSANAFFMIHNVSGWAYGDVNDVEQMAATLRKFNNTARDYYAEATGKSKEEIEQMMNAETWMTAQEAKDHGFIKQVVGESNITNAIPRESWHFKNLAVLNQINAAVKPAPQPDSQNFIQNQFDDMKRFFQSIVDAIKGTKPAENSTSITGEQLAEAVQQPFEELAMEIENSISTQVTNSLQSEAVQTAISNAVTQAVNNAVTEAVKPLNQKITDLENEIANGKGNASSGAKNETDGPAPVGGFKKK